MDSIKVAIFSVAHVHTHTYVNCLLANNKAEIIGIYDDNFDRVKPYTEKFGIKYYSNCNELLEQKPHFALVCSENALHQQLTLAAAAKKVDVLCEKPLGITKASMAEMLKACSINGVKLMTTFPNRYVHSFLNAKRAVEEGRIGKLIGIKATNKGSMPGGWFVKPELSGGGSVIDHTVHVADLVNWLLGCVPDSVYAVCANRLYDGISVDDVSFVNFKYPNGVFVSLDSSWSRSAAFPYGRDLTMNIIGTEGSIFIDYFAEKNQVFSNEKSKAEWSYYGEDKDMMMINDVIMSYEAGYDFMISGQDGYNSAIVALAAYCSIREGREVLISEI